MTMSNDVWKWIAAVMFSLVTLFLGGFATIAQHEDIPGHPVMVERVDSHVKEYKEETIGVNGKLEVLEEKLDSIEETQIRQGAVLEEIRRKLP